MMATHTLEELDAFSAEQFKNWLFTELRNKYDPDREVRYRACDLRHLDISTGESHLDVIDGLMRKLCDQAKENVREALTRLLIETKLDECAVEIMRDIIALISVTGARQAVQHIEAFCDGPWGERYKDLRYDCVATLLGWNLREDFERLRVKYGFR